MQTKKSQDLTKALETELSAAKMVRMLLVVSVGSSHISPPVPIMPHSCLKLTVSVVVAVGFCCFCNRHLLITEGKSSIYATEILR